MIGKGGTAEVIEYGEEKVCKLFYKGQPKEYVILEYENGKEIYRHHIPVPKTFEIINTNGRIGIVYERIYGKPLKNMLNEKNEDKVLGILLNLHRDILSRRSKNLLSYKDFLKEIVKISLNHDLCIIKEINSLPDGDNICHGDFHLENILIKPDGTAVVVDFMNVCRGPALYDIAKTFCLLKKYKKSFADDYLSRMKVPEDDVAKYVKIIEKCRQYEKDLNETIRKRNLLIHS